MYYKHGYLEYLDYLGLGNKVWLAVTPRNHLCPHHHHRFLPLSMCRRWELWHVGFFFQQHERGRHVQSLDLRRRSGPRSCTPPEQFRQATGIIRLRRWPGEDVLAFIHKPCIQYFRCSFQWQWRLRGKPKSQTWAHAVSALLMIKEHRTAIIRTQGT